MDELKVKLFEATFHYLSVLTDMLCDSEETEGFEHEWTHTHGKFAGVYGIIEGCGLAEEFHEWKKRILEGEGGEVHEVERKDPVNE